MIGLSGWFLRQQVIIITIFIISIIFIHSLIKMKVYQQVDCDTKTRPESEPNNDDDDENDENDTD